LKYTSLVNVPPLSIPKDPSTPACWEYLLLLVVGVGKTSGSTVPLGVNQDDALHTLELGGPCSWAIILLETRQGMEQAGERRRNERTKKFTAKMAEYVQQTGGKKWKEV
jgi:hypothetical protein